MKKLLSILAAVGLTATASTSVVACGKSSATQVESSQAINHFTYVSSTKFTFITKGISNQTLSNLSIIDITRNVTLKGNDIQGVVNNDLLTVTINPNKAIELISSVQNFVIKWNDISFKFSIPAIVTPVIDDFTYINQNQVTFHIKNDGVTKDDFNNLSFSKTTSVDWDAYNWNINIDNISITGHTLTVTLKNAGIIKSTFVQQMSFNYNSKSFAFSLEATKDETSLGTGQSEIQWNPYMSDEEQVVNFSTTIAVPKDIPISVVSNGFQELTTNTVVWINDDKTKAVLQTVSISPSQADDIIGSKNDLVLLKIDMGINLTQSFSNISLSPDKTQPLKITWAIDKSLSLIPDNGTVPKPSDNYQTIGSYDAILPKQATKGLEVANQTKGISYDESTNTITGIKYVGSTDFDWRKLSIDNNSIKNATEDNNGNLTIVLGKPFSPFMENTSIAIYYQGAKDTQSSQVYFTISGVGMQVDYNWALNNSFLDFSKNVIHIKMMGAGTYSGPIDINSIWVYLANLKGDGLSSPEWWEQTTMQAKVTSATLSGNTLTITFDKPLGSSKTDNGENVILSINIFNDLPKYGIQSTSVQFSPDIN